MGPVPRGEQRSGPEDGSGVLSSPRLDDARSGGLQAPNRIALPANRTSQDSQLRKTVPVGNRSVSARELHRSPLPCFVYAGSYLGLRWGELAGLKRANLDLGAQRVRVVGSLERAGHGFRYVEETKSSTTRRTLSLPRFLVDILSEHLALVADSDFVFPAPNGGCLNYHSWKSRFWNPAVRKAGPVALQPSRDAAYLCRPVDRPRRPSPGDPAIHRARGHPHDDEHLRTPLSQPRRRARSCARWCLPSSSRGPGAAPRLFGRCSRNKWSRKKDALARYSGSQ